MKLSFRSLRRFWGRIFRPSAVRMDGLILHAGRDLPDSVLDEMYAGTYEGGERKLVCKLIRPGDRVLELGAGLGAVGLLCARLAGGLGRVVSYEANERLGEFVSRNHRLNERFLERLPDVIFRPVTPDGAEVSFHRCTNILSSSVHDRRIESEKVVLQSLRFYDLLNDYKPDVVVMDVEGLELALIESAALTGVRGIVVEVHPSIIGAEGVSRVEFALQRQGFKRVDRLHGNLLYQR